MKIGDIEVFTIREAAKRLDLDRTTLFRQIQSGAMKADNDSGTWLVTSQELERYARENRGKPGRKRKSPAPPPEGREMP